MFKIREVENVKWSNFYECKVVTYTDDTVGKLAACAEGLVVKQGDKVEIYTDDKLRYCGLSALALKVVK